MTMRALWIVLVLAIVMALPVATPTFAVEPDEILDDPALEARARELSKGLRCLVCRNESIDESHADLAKDLRLLVRERLVAGDSDDEAIEFIVARYGEYVLLQPNARGANLMLWFGGPLVMILTLIGSGVYIRRRSQAEEPKGGSLTAEEEARLSEILKD